jgi:RNA polymerase sigma-70 factor (ECF subfamily)
VEGSLDYLLLSARAGSRRAFEQLVAALERELTHFCLRLVGPAELDDTLQETYIALWRALPQFRGESSARTYVYAIARRTAARCSRRQARWSELAALCDSSGESDFGLSLEIEEALSRLEADKRTAILLTRIFGFSYAEAALICDCPVGTIRSRVSRARQELIEHGLTERAAG